MEEQPIRVAHIIGKMVGGGVESFIMNYYRNIDTTKVQFDFIIDSDSSIVPTKEIEALGGKIYKISPYQKIGKYMKELTEILKKNKYQIVHSHLNALSIFPLCCAFFSKVPIRIAHSHSTTNKKEWKKNIIKNLLKPFSKVFATHYFACSEHAGRWLFGNKTFDKGKVVLINNAIDVNKFVFENNVRNKIREELNIEEKYVIGHIGRFVKQKNHDFLLEIFRSVYQDNEKTVLLLIGEGPLENDIKQKVKEYNLDDKVIFLGVRENVNELLQAMDLFVFPSLYEGLGIVLIEAQCSGLQCIASSEVPNEVNINNLVKFMDLNEGIDEWKNEIIKYENLTRNSVNLNEFDKYNIQIKGKELEEKYIRMIQE